MAQSKLGGGAKTGGSAKSAVAAGGEGGGVAIGNISTFGGLGNNTQSHDNNGNYLLLGISHGYPADNGAIETAVTWNGVSMTKIADSAESGFSRRVTVWALLAAATGVHNFVITEPTGGFKAWVLQMVSVQNVNASTPTGTVVTATGTSTPATVNVTSASGELVIDFVSTGPGSDVTGMTVGAGQTQQVNLASGTAVTDIRGGASVEAGTATVTMSWSIATGGIGNWAIAAIPIKP
jgi:hypothetical protein